MATTVNAAFDEFLSNKVNLDPEATKKARSSRDWLISQIQAFDGKVEYFLHLYGDIDIAFGSFARRTKIRELDDIDIMIGIKAQGATYGEYSDRIEITVPSTADPLHRYCNDNTDILNSRSVINKFVSALSKVPNYEKAEIKRTQEAATLKLVSYTWNFDIVPCFFTTPEADGRTFYLIPDGNGSWKKTDPRKDGETVTQINQNHDGHMLNAIRILKFWNKRPTAPAMPSYLIETMLVTYYMMNNLSKASQFVDLEIPKLLNYISSAVYRDVYDLKGIQGNINSLTIEERMKISQRAALDHQRALVARKAETDGDHKGSIQKWAEVFGSDFPKYE